MSLRLPLSALLPMLALAACAPTQPDDAAGVGFGDYGSYMAQNTGRATPQGGYNGQLVQNGGPQGQMTGAAAPTATGAGGNGDIGAAALQALGRGPEAGAGAGASAAPMAVPGPQSALQPVPAPMSAAQPGVHPTAQAAPGPVIDNGGISSENDFKAVSSERSIEADRDRIQQNAATYQQIAPTALPQRSQNGPNIVEYAVNARNQLGEQVYPRSSLHISSVERNCGRFVSQDLAQIEFLKRGGPERDPGNLDPDGDGYACLWDPRPFQKR
ncbi:hypothetical protein V8J36_11965 [Frigidibacter sp. MR17.14]|uniref:hypothetical protein n=1 Tax=Frigidibacter sp. MR17.14 TaxID=3126509 RepID=UPI003012F055